MDREEAERLMESRVHNLNLRKHMLAVEAVMRALARHFREDEEIWGLTGLLHDIDYDETQQDFSRHGQLGAGWLQEWGFDERIVHAVKAHVGAEKIKSRLDRALYAVDPVTGLVVASALMHPSRGLKEVTLEFVLHRFREKRFAAGANREQIKTCENLDLELKEFIAISLQAMQEISDLLDL